MRSPFEITGILTAVQESRCRLIDQFGRSHLLLIAYDAQIEGDDLQCLLREGKPIRATIKPAPGLIGAVATTIQTVDHEHSCSLESQ